MANCKDCLGFEFCLDRLGTTKYYDNAIAANNVEELCQKFKDRNRFVEVVRCKDCKMFCPYLSFCSDNCIGSFGYCQITHMNVSLDFYCGQALNWSDN